MKIAIFSRTFDGVPGGVEKMVLTLASELKKLNHFVLIISIDSPNAQAFYKWPDGVVWEKVSLGDPDLKASFWTRINRVMAIRRILKQNQIESVVGFQIGAFALIRLASVGLGIHAVAAERNAPTLFNFIRRGRIFRKVANAILFFSSCITVQMPSYRLLYPKFLQNKIFYTPNPDDHENLHWLMPNLIARSMSSSLLKLSSKPLTDISAALETAHVDDGM